MIVLRKRDMRLMVLLPAVLVAGCADDSNYRTDIAHGGGGSGVNSGGGDSQDGGRRRFTKDGREFEEYSVEHTDYTPPPSAADKPVDDVLDPARVPEFDAGLVHSDAVEGWDINLSRTVFQLDVPLVRPDVEPDLLVLRRSYADAVHAMRDRNVTVLPSVNAIDGKAKQFDDGLYAALDQAYYSGLEQALASHVDLIRRLAEAVGPDSVAAPFLAAGLKIAGVSAPVTDAQERDRLLAQFESSPLRSKPLGFYNWSPELQQCYRFLKFFQEQFWLNNAGRLRIPRALGEAVAADDALRADYQRAVDFFSRLTNPPVTLSLLNVPTEADAAAVAEQQLARGLHPAVSVFPASTSKEQRLFEALFPDGLPPNANLMQELIQAVRSGAVDLAPENESGWYDYQAFALETFLLPDRGAESVKLLLSGRYKQRMLDAFAALITKRRETHVRQLAVAEAPMMAVRPLERIAPRLRLEPNATYYLRTARAYHFLQTFLESTIGHDALAGLHGLRETGPREPNLAAELASQRALFYGCYLLAMEDLGLRPELTADELSDPDDARRTALDWLAHWSDDPDLAVDTRVIVPVTIDPERRVTNVWGTAGVRLANLDVSFAPGFGPSVRPAGSSDEWQPAAAHILESKRYVIPVDEFVTAELPRLDCPTREEFRALCDAAGTSPKIREALSGGR